MTGRVSRAGSALVAGLVGVLLLAGCGADAPAGESPFATRLQQIDRALAARHFVQARADLTSLAAEARAARDAGDLDDTSADAILRAIVGLKETLPAASPTPSPSPTPTPTASRVAAPDGATSEKPAKGAGKGGGKGKGNK